MKYEHLATLYNQLEATAKRLEKTHLVAGFLPDVKDKELETIMLLLQGRIFLSYDERNIGVADKLVVKAISLASGMKAQDIEKSWKKTGDLGQSAEQILGKRRQQSLNAQELTTEKVLGTLQKLAAMQGAGTVDSKTKIIADLLTSSTPFEARFIVRTLLQDLRIGLGEGTLRDAITWAYLGKELGIAYDPEAKDITLDAEKRSAYNSATEQIQAAIDTVNDFAKVARVIKEHGIAKLKTLEFTPGSPIKVMLAQKVKTIAEGFETVGLPCRMEYKYDGFRLEIHGWAQGGKRHIKLFTRRLEDVSAQFPDVVAFALEHIKADSFILDSEAVGYDTKTGKYKPFQEISQRIRRKYDIDKLAKELPVEVNVFDVLYIDGKSTIALPFSERRAIVEKAIRQKSQDIVAATSREIENEKDAESFYRKSLAAGNEGVMLKNLAGAYKPGSRVGFMVKLKPVLDPLDLAIVGAEWGEGKRSSWLSSFTLACFDEDSGEYVEIGKVGTGIKEIEGQEREGGAEGELAVSFEQLTALLKPHILEERGRGVRLAPKVIVEVKFEEIQKSPSYTSGYALRFPRVVRLREDKDDASTLEQVRHIYEEQ